MQPIKTGSTLERIIRHGIFTLIVVIYAALSFWDGWTKYAQDNLTVAKQELPAEAQALAKYDERVKSANILVPAEDDKSGRVVRFKKGDKLADIQALLGPPAWSGSDGRSGFRAVWIGPGGRLSIWHTSLGTVTNPEPKWVDGKHTELDILFNKVMACVLGPLGLVLLIHYLGVFTRGATLSDAGLKHSGHPLIPFEAMSGWDPTDFRKKGQIRLSYECNGSPGTVVLDDYKLRAFPAIVEEICRRKGFENPIEKK